MTKIIFLACAGGVIDKIRFYAAGSPTKGGLAQTGPFPQHQKIGSFMPITLVPCYLILFHSTSYGYSSQMTFICLSRPGV
jgi:hypothetical protein